MSRLFRIQLNLASCLRVEGFGQEPLVNEVPEQEPVVTVAFRIEIDDLVDSVLQLIDVDFAKVWWQADAQRRTSRDDC